MYYFVEKEILIQDLGFKEVALCNTYLPRSTGKRIYIMISVGYPNFIWKDKTYTLLKSIYSNGRCFNMVNREYIPIDLIPSHGKVVLTLLDENQKEVSGESLLHFR